jgi:hypothetical protein
MRNIAWLLILCVASLAAEVPPGWKLVKSPQRLTRTASPTDHGGGGLCQLAVPGNWVVDTEADKTVGQMGHMKSPNDKASVSIQEHPPGQTLSDATKVALQFDKRAKVMEQSSNRVWLKSPYVLGTTWTVLVAGNPVCEAHFIIEDPAMQDVAKKIAATLRLSK